ncbi:multidrug efflux system, subunit C [Beijerinckiaceae bacterium RH AL1]|nr:multidrug efflux system, subunit C [Beijerinckiaceae bacterium RH CH11]VVB48124.1 multidrug efflux system, subunit C [Beijerinckiaceae bacterium RH AL8]VVC56196.1 multidrug efflux system, subunit C [Beijerinckiaceae bacterium RH AL1]
MNFSAPFIRRPIGTMLLAIGVFLIGAVSYTLLPVASLPGIDFPAVFIATQYPGASPENMASTVAAPIERRVGEIAGVTELTSINSLGSSVIIAIFDLSRNVAAAARDVQAALNAAATDLPAGLPNVPIFRKANPNNIPVLILAVTSDSLSPSAVYDAADTVLIQRISQVSGVSDVSVAGADQPAIRVTADPQRLSAMGLSQDDVRTTIVNANALSPTGAIDGSSYARTIATDDQLKTLDDYKSLVVRNVAGRSVILSDVATVENSTRNARSEATFMGKPAILIYVRKQASANVIETVDRVKALIPEIRRFMPAGIDVQILNDRTTSIRASVDDMLATLAVTIALVMMVVLVFLRRLTPTAAAGVTVPLALAGTFALMYLVGFSIDNISLMALATSVGFVVDDAIVMIENIDKAREAGMSPMRAALVGSKQIGFTVISISVSLMAAFIPLLLLGGVAGMLFREFSVTLAFAIIISTIASLTITPMICANFTSKKPPRKPNRIDRIIEGVLSRNAALYAATLRVVLRHRIMTLLVMAGTIGLTVFLFAKTPKGVFPEDETDLIMGTTEAPAATSFQALVPLQHRAAKLVQDDPAVAAVGSSVGNSGTGPSASELNEGKLFISLKPSSELNGDTTAQIVDRLRKKLKTIVGLDTFLIPRTDLKFGGRDTKSALSLTLTDSDYAELTRTYPLVEDRIKQVPGLVDVTTDHEAAGLQANVIVDRLAASRLLVTMANIDNTLNNAFAQRQISTIYSPRNQYRVILESPADQQRDLNDILATYVPAGVSLQNGTSLSGAGVQTALNTTPNNGQAQTATTGPSTQTSTSSTSAASPATANITAVQGTTSGGATVTANPTGQIRLQSMARVEVGTAPLSVNHQGQFPEVTISFNLKPGAIQQEVSDAVLAAVEQMHLPDTVHFGYTGDAKLFQQSSGGQGPLLWAALISVYIVLGVLYESFAHPLTIISTLPSAGLGALLALNVTGTQLTLIAFIGIVLLIGIVKKNGIMLVDFALHAERERGLPAEAAIYEACVERFRPILMTTLAALLGALPLILATGPGSALRRPLGITIAGGLIVSQMLTLYTTPVIYLYLDKLHHRLRRMRIPRRFGRRRRVAPAE